MLSFLHVQVIPQKSGIVKKLDSAGAVLVAKVSTGEMATGDNWWGGSSRCPWNIALGAGGSSAGPGAASAAALMGFTIGTETGGSILGPATRNGVSGFRPTIGLVSRSWTMALAQTFDKPGPMARSAADCAAIFDLIRGRDKDDPNTCNVALPDPFKMNIAQMKIGYSKETPPTVVDYYSSLGATMVRLAATSSLAGRAAVASSGLVACRDRQRKPSPHCNPSSPSQLGPPSSTHTLTINYCLLALARPTGPPRHAAGLFPQPRHPGDVPHACLHRSRRLL